MDIGNATVLASVITVMGGLIGSVIKQLNNLRKENREDHGVVMSKLDNVQKGIDRVSERLDDHIDWHLNK